MKTQGNFVADLPVSGFRFSVFGFSLSFPGFRRF